MDDKECWFNLLDKAKRNKVITELRMIYTKDCYAGLVFVTPEIKVYYEYENEKPDTFKVEMYVDRVEFSDNVMLLIGRYGDKIALSRPFELIDPMNTFKKI